MADTTPSAAVPGGEEEQSTGEPEVLTSIFPPPPSHAARFTPDNLARLAVLEAHHAAHPELDAWSEMEPSARIAAQAEVLTRAVQDGEGTEEQLLPPPKWDVLAEMGSPRLDWIHEEGAYFLLGDRWPIIQPEPSLEAAGVHRLYPAGSFDRREALQSLLRTLLHTHLQLVDSLTHPPREYMAYIPAPLSEPSVEGQPAPPPQMIPVPRSIAQDRWEHMRTTVINMQHLINELRPKQARDSLKSTMRAQLDRRRAETELLKTRCVEMREQIQSIKTEMARVDTEEDLEKDKPTASQPSQPVSAPEDTEMADPHGAR